MNTDKQQCIHEANEFGTFDNVTGVCWVCGKTAKQAGEGNAPRVTWNVAAELRKQRKLHREERRNRPDPASVKAVAEGNAPRVHPAGLGRGSNPISKQNLKGPFRDAYVYERGAGIGWTKIAGPMTYRQAYDHAAKLEALNKTDTKPLYVATRGECEGNAPRDYDERTQVAIALQNTRKIAEQEAAESDALRKPLTDKNQQDKRNLYRTAWTLVGGYAFTSNQCVAVRYLGLGQYRINETPETLHECHLTDFTL
jgi:hypothetical protein